MSTPLSATDITIVGAGPAGATMSLFLAREGIPHTLIDKATFPRDKADGNVYGAKVIEILDRLNPDYFRKLMTQTDRALGCTTARVFTPNGQHFNLQIPPSDGENGSSENVAFFTMNRRDFDSFLVGKLDRNYADIRLDTTLSQIERQSDGWRVTLETAGQTTTLNPKLTIAADGVNSTVLQQLGIGQPIDRYYDSVQGYFRGITGFDGPEIFHIEGHFLSESNPGFFFIVPLAGGIFNVGIGKPRSDVQQENVDLCELLPEILHHHPQLTARFSHAEAVSDLRPWPVMVGSSEQVPVSGSGYLAIGDAAGLCNPLTCYGTGNAMVSGMLAAQQVKQSVSERRFDGEALKGYDRALYDRFQKEFQTSNFLKTFTKRDWLFNLVTGSSPVQGALRKTFKGTSAMLKKL